MGNACSKPCGMLPDWPSVGYIQQEWQRRKQLGIMTVGLCGGFTTFSTFSKEALVMLQAGNFWGFAGYVSISVIAGIALVALGYFLVR